LPLQPIRFIDEPIEALFKQPPMLEKKPGCPSAFVWQGRTFSVIEVLEEWVDYARRGRMARNMQPQHAARAAQRGSWGVGRFHFRVRASRVPVEGETDLEGERRFELYYDRAPKNSDQRKGAWVLMSELKET
jgi:hypothetical protein